MECRLLSGPAAAAEVEDSKGTVVCPGNAHNAAAAAAADCAGRLADSIVDPSLDAPGNACALAQQVLSGQQGAGFSSELHTSSKLLDDWDSG